MLNVVLWEEGLEEDDIVSDVAGYFEVYYEQSWFQSQLARDIVKGIDDTTYISGEYFQSPVFGGIPPRDLSTGCKGCLCLLNVDNIIVKGEAFGDNCASWLLKIGEIKDITISIHHVLKFPNISFKIFCVNTNVILTSYKDYINELLYTSLDDYKNIERVD